MKYRADGVVGGERRAADAAYAEVMPRLGLRGADGDTLLRGMNAGGAVAAAGPDPAAVLDALAACRQSGGGYRVADEWRGERFSAAVKAFFGYEEEPPIDESPEPATQSKRELLTKSEQRSAGERWRAS